MKEEATKQRGRPRLDTPERRLSVLRAGADLFTRSGFDTVTMDSIAAAAGLSKPVVYRMYPSKDDLRRASLDMASVSLEAALACWPDPREVVARALAYGRREPELFVHLLSQQETDPEFSSFFDLTTAQLLVRLQAPGPSIRAAQRRAAQAMALCLIRAMVGQVRDARTTDDDAFLSWCENMIASWTDHTR